MRSLLVLVSLAGALLAETEERWLARGFARIPPGDVRWSRNRTLEARAVLGGQRWLHSGGAYSLAYRPDGRQLVTCGGQKARIWDVETGRLVRLLGAQGTEPLCAAWSPDGKWLALGGSDTTVRIYDAETGREQRVLRGFRHLDAWPGVDSLAISPDGERLVACDAYDEICIWDTATWAELFRRTAHRQRIAAAAFSPDGSWFATVGGDYNLRRWQTVTGTQRYEAHGHETFVQDVAVAPDGRWLATASMDNTVRIWDADTGKQKRVLGRAGSPGNMWTVAIDPNAGRLVAGDGRGQLTCWDPADGSRLWRVQGHLDEVHSVRFDPRGGRIASTGYDGSIRFFDPASGAELDRPERHRLAVTAVAATPDGKRVVSASDDGTIRIWDARSFKLLQTRRPHGNAEIKALAISPDGKWAVSGAEVLDPKRNLKRWKLDDPNAPPTALAGHELLYAVAISPDGGRIVSTGGCWVRIWDASDNRMLHTLKGHQSFTTALTVDAGGTWAASGNHDATVRVWDLQTGDCRHVLADHDYFVESLARAPDGSWLAAGNGAEIKFWDPRSGECLKTVVLHEARVVDLAASTDGRWVYVASRDRTLRVVDVARGQQADLFRIVGGPTAIAVQGDHVWVGCEDGTVRAFMRHTAR